VTTAAPAPLGAGGLDDARRGSSRFAPISGHAVQRVEVAGGRRDPLAQLSSCRCSTVLALQLEQRAVLHLSRRLRVALERLGISAMSSNGLVM
jgi:hypothetical protein